MVTEKIQLKDIKTLVKNYTPNIGGPKYVKQILMDIKRVIDRNTVIVGELTHH